MKALALLSSLLTSLVIAGIAGSLTLGALVVLHPFDAVVAPAGSAAALAALRSQIDAVRQDLSATEAALANAVPVVAAPASAVDGLAQQLAVARDRADLARRHARAIRDTVASDGDVAGLPEIRNSVVVGQLLAQRTALDGQIAEQGGRLGPSHPTMRALRAQSKALLAQINVQATAIADALDAEAGIDEIEVERLRTELGAPDPVPEADPDLAALRQTAASQRAQLDRLMESFLALQSEKGVATLTMWQSLGNPVNILLAGIVALAALVVQLAVAMERRQARRRQAQRQADADLWAWTSDKDTATPPATTVFRVSEPELRRAS